jgi:hypothetical protein
MTRYFDIRIGLVVYDRSDEEYPELVGKERESSEAPQVSVLAACWLRAGTRFK